MIRRTWRLILLGHAFLCDLERNQRAADRLDKALREVLRK